MHDVIVIYVGAFAEITRDQPLEDIWTASGIDKDLDSNCATVNEDGPIIYCSIAIEGLNHVPKWSNRSSKVVHLVFSLGQWCAIVAYQIPCLCG